MLRIDRHGWSDKAADVLAPALEEDAEVIAEAVREGRAQLYAVEDHGYMVVAVEQRGRGPELVLIAGAGHGLHEVIPAFRNLAKRQGIATMRTHVRRRGLVRMYRRHGFWPDQTILRAEV